MQAEHCRNHQSASTVKFVAVLSQAFEGLSQDQGLPPLTA